MGRWSGGQSQETGSPSRPVQSRHEIMLRSRSRQILQDIVTGELWRVIEQAERGFTLGVMRSR